MISQFISSIQDKRTTVGIVGDSMVDVYTCGTVDRISPEFPVPVQHSTEDYAEYYGGGAANVCSQFKHFNTLPLLFSFFDYEGASNLDIDFRFSVETGTMPRKIRFYDDDFPLFRRDIEKPNYGINNISESRKLLLTKFESTIKDLDVVILSNYNKGLFDCKLATKIIEICNKNNVPTVVDPKNNYHFWLGCTVLKPNYKEACEMTKETSWEKQEIAFKHMGFHSVIVTLQGKGVVGYCGKESFEYKPKTTVKDVNSVVGAGDAFMAILSLGVAKKIPLEKIAAYAFECGAQFVRSKRARPVSLYEIHRRIDPLNAKIMSVNNIKYLRETVYKDERWVFTNGCFDLLHVGHLYTLQTAKSRGDKLVVALNSDESVKRLKGANRPIIDLQERKQVVAALECVDFVVSFAEDVPYNTIKELHPNVLVKGEDYTPDRISGVDLVDEVYLTDLIAGNSTTNIIGKIKNI